MSGSLPAPSDLSASPARRIAELCSQLGSEAVAVRCAELLRGADATEDPALLLYLGGRHAVAVLAGKDREYWPRVWAARALRYAWSPTATPALVTGLRDPCWRVAEMSAKVAWLHEVGEAADDVVPLATHPLPRVRTAAVRALGRLAEHEHLDTVLSLTDDPDAGVRTAAERARRAVERRLDLDLEWADVRAVNDRSGYSPPP